MSFKLPVCGVRRDDGTVHIGESSSYVYPAIFKIREHFKLNYVWIGWPGIIPESEAERQQLE